jgi:hypothetical protein
MTQPGTSPTNPEIGSSSLVWSSSFTGAQSMSKNVAEGELGPFSSTSFHQAFAPVPMPMWFGTKSTMCSSPRSATALANAACASSPPSSGLISL